MLFALLSLEISPSVGGNNVSLQRSLTTHHYRHGTWKTPTASVPGRVTMTIIQTSFPAQVPHTLVMRLLFRFPHKHAQRHTHTFLNIITAETHRTDKS